MVGWVGQGCLLQSARKKKINKKGGKSWPSLLYSVYHYFTDCVCLLLFGNSTTCSLRRINENAIVSSLSIPLSPTHLCICLPTTTLRSHTQNSISGVITIMPTRVLKKKFLAFYSCILFFKMKIIVNITLSIKKYNTFTLTLYLKEELHKISNQFVYYKLFIFKKFIYF